MKRTTGKQVAILRLPAEKSAASHRTPKTQHKNLAPSLFAEGVDVGVELALRWMETELARCEPSSPAIQGTLRRVRRLSRQTRQSSYLQQVLSASPAPTSRSRRVLAPARARVAVMSS